MGRLVRFVDAIIAFLSGKAVESVALLFVRVALAGIFWRSGRSKVVEGTWLQISDGTNYLFANDYKAVPLPPEFAAHVATYSEHFFPILLVLGLATRFGGFGLLMMTLTIQIFVFPEAWWPVHSIWVALCLIVIARGGGWFSLDQLIGPRLPRGRA